MEYSITLLLIYFLHSSLSLNPTPLIYPSLPPFSLVITNLSSWVCFWFAIYIPLHYSINSTRKWYHIVFVIYCVKYSLGPSILLQMADFHSYVYTLTHLCCCCFSVTNLCLTLQPHELQHARLPWPSLSAGVCSDSCPMIQWCHTTISSPVAPFSWLQSFPASGAFPMSQFFASGGQSIGLPMNIQCWFPLGLTGLFFLQSKGFSRVFSSTTIQKHQFFGIQPSLWANSHICTWLLEKP